MPRTLAALGFAALLAACSSGPLEAQRHAERDEAYVPIGSNIARRESRRTDVPTTVGQREASAPAAGKTSP